MTNDEQWETLEGVPITSLKLGDKVYCFGGWRVLQTIKADGGPYLHFSDLSVWLPPKGATVRVMRRVEKKGK